MTERKVKGIFLAHVHDYVVREHGQAALDRVIAALPPAPAKLLSAPAGFEWYPLSACVEVERKLVELLYGGDLEQAQRLGEYDITESVNKVYRFLFRILDTTTILSRSGKLWNSFYDGGRVVVAQPRATEVVLTLEDFDSLHPVHCHEIQGAFRGLLKLCRLERFRVEHPECRHRGARACVYRLEW